ncbi:MAG: hypothetical protein FWG24_04995 [Eggerthellaceae bacterium]|nr:hypothetical protein [Eggerthellaceae bacterium]MDR2721412.1 hypothetical protein [Coriobacteriaceae bacterium]
MVKRSFTAEGGVEITDEALEKLAEPWERGEVPGIAAGFVSAPGRPRISEDETKIVAFRLPVSVIKAIDLKAQQHGETRSQRMREAVIADLLKA